MPSYPKVATCCYCGTRAALVLGGKVQHELACSACGAPLHDLKMLPRNDVGQAVPERATRAGVTGKHRSEKPNKPTKYQKKKYKKKRKTSFLRSALGEAFDVIEDIFD